MESTAAIPKDFVNQQNHCNRSFTKYTGKNYWNISDLNRYPKPIPKNIILNNSILQILILIIQVRPLYKLRK